MAYAYNDAGLRTSTAATIDGVADYLDEYAYDSQGRLVAIAQYGTAGSSAVADKQITLGHNDQGLLATVTRYTDGNLAVLAQYSYDSAGRLAALVYSQGETVLASYAWTYGDANSPLPLAGEGLGVRAESAFSWLPSGGLMPGQDTTAIVDALWEGTGTPAGLITEITSLDGTVSYSYDSAGQLLAASYTTGQAAEAYSYDAAGNRVTANGAAYLTGPNNQLLFDGVFSYSYDPEGNRTARFIDVNSNGLLDAGDTAATTYAWDHRNRLTRVTDYATYGDPATRAVDYLYDTENRWIGRDVDLDADGIIDTRTRFAYDGNQIALQFDRALAPTGDPTDPLTIDHLSHRYLWNPAAVDQLMADEHVTTDPSSPGSILWPLADHLGTIRDLAAYNPATDTTTVVNHRTFDAYGNLQSQTSTNFDCLFAYTGRPLDQETGLQSNLHRWYDATTGRWMSEDPIGFEGKDGNLYVYVGNGPVNAADPDGLRELRLVFRTEAEMRQLGVREVTIKYLRNHGYKYAGDRGAMLDALGMTSFTEKRGPVIDLVTGKAETWRDSGIPIEIIVWSDASTGKEWYGLECWAETIEEKTVYAPFDPMFCENPYARLSRTVEVPTGQMLVGYRLFDSAEELFADIKATQSMLLIRKPILAAFEAATMMWGGKAVPSARSPMRFRSPTSVPARFPQVEPSLAVGEDFKGWIHGKTGILGYLGDDGFIEFYYMAGPQTPRGGVMFAEMITMYGRNAKGIRALWRGTGDASRNYDDFMAALARGLTTEQAAISTPTGHLAAKHGFTVVKDVKISESTKRVVVEFVRP